MAFFTVEETEGITDLKSVLESYMFPEIASSLPAPALWTSWTTWATMLVKFTDVVAGISGR